MNGLDSYSRQVFIYLDPIFYLYQSLNRLPIWNSQNCSMFPLAFVAGWLQGHWWGFISRNYVVLPIFFLMNVFIALKGSHFWFYIRSRGHSSKPAWPLGRELCQYEHNVSSTYASRSQTLTDDFCQEHPDSFVSLSFRRSIIHVRQHEN